MLRNPMRLAAILALIAVIASQTPCVADPVELATFIALPRPALTAVQQYGPNNSQAADLFLPSARWSASVGNSHPWWMLERDHGRTRTAAAHRGGVGEPRDRGVEHRLSARERAARRLSGDIPGCRRGNRPAAVRCSSLWPGSLANCPGRALRRRASRTLGCGAGPVAGKQSHLPCGALAYPARSSVWPGSVILKHSLASCRSSAGRELSSDWPRQRIRPDRYAEISPAALPAARVPIVMVSGMLDRLVPPYVAYDYARAMQRKHPTPIELVDIPGAGHFDLVTPGTRAWEEVRARIAAALGTAR